MRAILLLNESDSLASWELAALEEAIAGGLVITRILHCMNTPARKVTRRNAVYYGFAALARRGLTTTDGASIRDLISDDVPRTYFHAETEGAWQRIPAEIANNFGDVDVLIKFGMTLLRAPESMPLKHGVLSYHHGDPERYRGRPAGFYELMNGERIQGVIVQQLSDTLDGGNVLAKAFSPVIPHSYGQTVQSAHLAGVPLLAKAVATLERGSDGSRPSELGNNYRLPTTRTVLRQAQQLARRKAGHLAYGLVREKRWLVGQMDWKLDPEGDQTLPSEEIAAVRPPRGYVFAADPWSDGTQGLYCEVLNRATGLGEIAHWDGARWEVLQLGNQQRGHMSYPQVVRDKGELYLFPEIASFESPMLFPGADDGTSWGEGIALKGLEGARLVDATLHQSGGIWYLFAGEPGTASFRLDLWWAYDLFGPYQKHPTSPVCVDPRGARMAGPLAELNGRLYRFGQDGTERYGGGIRIHEVLRLEPDTYQESPCGRLRCSSHWGPHTVNVDGDRLVLDYFSERTTWAAGLRRLRARFAERRSPTNGGR